MLVKWQNVKKSRKNATHVIWSNANQSVAILPPLLLEGDSGERLGDEINRVEKQFFAVHSCFLVARLKKLRIFWIRTAFRVGVISKWLGGPRHQEWKAFVQFRLQLSVRSLCKEQFTETWRSEVWRFLSLCKSVHKNEINKFTRCRCFECCACF